MIDLTRPECLRLLAATKVGRVVVSGSDSSRPLIRPVNYVFDKASRSVLLRSAPGSKLHALRESSKAVFEIDGVDLAGRLGWSVIVVGVTGEITNPAELRRIDALALESWAPGRKDHWIRIRANTVSGRRIAAAANRG